MVAEEAWRREEKNHLGFAPVSVFRDLAAMVFVSKKKEKKHPSRSVFTFVETVRAGKLVECSEKDGFARRKKEKKKNPINFT